MLDLSLFPSQPGVYLMKNQEGAVIYVGKAKNLQKRIRQYFSPSRDKRVMIPLLIAQMRVIDTIIVSSEKEALLLENTLIKQHQPKFNSCLKDDKTFASLMINYRHPWPMIRLVRFKGIPEEEARYFGPYTSAYAARETLDLLTKLFPLRQCSDEELKRRKRPCLLYSIKRCCAPCVHLCTREEYAILVKRAALFLEGKNTEILEALYLEMEQASQSLKYEKAASLLKTIRQIEHVIHANQVVAQVAGENRDALATHRNGQEIVIAQMLFRNGKLTDAHHFVFPDNAEEEEQVIRSFLLQHYQRKEQLPKEILLPCPLEETASIREIFREKFSTSPQFTFPKRGEKKELLELAKKNAENSSATTPSTDRRLLDLQEILKLRRYPLQIECFDVSHIAGKHPVAALVTFTNGRPNPSGYRLFHIRSSFDDYGSLREVLERRLSRKELPDLIIVDGGKGQLQVALDVLKEKEIVSIDVIALTKEEGRHDKGIRKERIFLPDQHEPICLNPHSKILFLLQEIRDEAHRKAISFHRTARSRSTITSQLDTLPGIGQIKRTRLLQRFGSIAQICQATDEALLAVSGITQKDVATIRTIMFGIPSAKTSSDSQKS